MLNRNSKRTFILVASCAASALVMTGCRSMPGAGMLGMRGEPSAETLAGNGPTVTYPAPPSASATPEAIASVAGGTGSSKRSGSSSPTTAQVAGFDISPGYAAQATNMAAAEANGIANQTAAKSGSATTTSDAMGPSSYAFGAKAFTPKSEPTSESGTSYALSSNSSIASVDAPLSAPSTSGGAFTPPPMGTTATSTVAAAPTAKGFTLPTDSPSFSAITPPSSSGTNVAMGPTTGTFAPPTATTGTSADDTPVASSPAFSTASAATGYTAPSSTTSVLPPALPNESISGDSGYMPGSTGTTTAYPTGGTTPTTNGSYYR